MSGIADVMTDLEIREALIIARELEAAGVPLFVASPCLPDCEPLPNARSRHEPGKGHNGSGYHLPTGWPTSRPRPTSSVVDRWEPGKGIAMVGGHLADVLDNDPRSGGTDSMAELRAAGVMPRSYGQASTPSGGTHDLIASLCIAKAVGVLPGIDLQSGQGDGEGRGFAWISPTVKISKVDGLPHPYRWTTRPDLALLLEEAENDDSGAALAGRVMEQRAAKGKTGAAPQMASAPSADALARVRVLAAELAAVPDGKGYPTIERDAFKVGQYVGAGQVGQAEAEATLIAALDSWTFKQSGDRAIREQDIRDQVAGGMAFPRPWDPPRPPPGGQGLGVPEGAAPQADAPARRREDELPPPGVPLSTARRLNERFRGAGVRLRRWRGDWYEHRVAHWSSVTEEAVRERLFLETEPCWYLHHDERKDVDEERPWNPTTRTVNGVLDALGTAVVRRPDVAEEDRCIAFANGVLVRAVGARELAAHTPDRFNLWSLPYAYDPAATCPTWLAFLGQQVPDAESQQLLREWFGYVVSGRTDLQKILHMYGVRRSGKSTILRVLRELIGTENTASVSIKGLTGAFGVQPLIGKSLALIADANWKVREVETACEAMKNISGEDPLDVERKHRTTWSGILRARFVVVGNDEPEFRDPSGALLGRMIHVHFSRSVYGREDPTLTGRLLAELPGILNWALDGLDTLERRGYFATPKASAEAEQDIARSTSPVAGFLSDCVTFMDPTMGLSEWLDDLYEAYRKWCGGQGIRVEMTKPQFSKALRSAVAGRADAKRQRPTKDAPQQQIFYGLTLVPPAPLGQEPAQAGGAPRLGQPRG